MGGTGVIDTFLGTFTRYIDSGFGLLGGEVAFIATTLIVIDVTLAALFWSWGADDDIIARLVKKTLFVGVFAYIIGNWNNLANIVFDSFAGLGLKGSGTSFTVQDLLRPGKVAQTGLDAARPLLESISDLMGWIAFFENFIQIACLLFAWALVLLAFFILAVQLFVTLIEFKLTTLAGFVLIPFGLFGKTAFMAERVLGNVVSSGIKVLCLPSSSASDRPSSPSLPLASAARPLRLTRPWQWSSLRFRCSAWESSVLASPAASSQAVRSSAPAPLWARGLPSAARRWPQVVQRVWPSKAAPPPYPVEPPPCVVALPLPAPHRRPTVSVLLVRLARRAWPRASEASHAQQVRLPHRRSSAPQRKLAKASSPASPTARRPVSEPPAGPRPWGPSAAPTLPPLPPAPREMEPLTGRSA